MISEKRKEYLKRYKRANRDKMSAYAREYYRRHADKWKQKYRKAKTLPGYTPFDERTTSGVGRKFELLALKVLPGSTDCNTVSFAGGYDVLWQGKRIEVKMRNINKKNTGWVFSFKKTCTADHCMLFCLNKEGDIERIIMSSYDGCSGMYISTKKAHAGDMCKSFVSGANMML